MILQASIVPDGLLLIRDCYCDVMVKVLLKVAKCKHVNNWPPAYKDHYFL
jgi:hypothetical protein